MLRKIKHYKTTLLAVLALVMFLGTLPLSAFSLGNAEPVQSEVSVDAPHITLDGVKTDLVELRAHEKLDISAECDGVVTGYQWQILHPEQDDLWINIGNAINESVSVSLALVGNMLNDEDVAQLRCRMTVNGEQRNSSPVTIRFRDEDNSSTVVQEGESTAPELVSGVQTLDRANSNVMALADGDNADDDASSDFVTVTIQYVRYDIKWENGKMVVDGEGNPVLEDTGVQAFTSYIATLQKGTDLNTTVNNPTMIGYDTFLEDATEASTSVAINLTNITDDVVYTVKYKPAKVKYSVRYFFQNIYDDLYAENTSLRPTVNDMGYTGSTPPESQMSGDVPGFTPLFYQPDSIAADGSTVFEVFYERNYYLMEFDCNGGYGAETLYNRYDSYVSVPTPVRPGYVFVGWDLVDSDEPGFVHDDDVEGHLDRIPSYHTAYKAIWKTDITSYTVVYWRENADDDGYSYWDSVQVGVNTNGTLNGTVHSNDHVSGTDHANATGLSEAAYFTYNAEKTVYEESQRTDLASDGKVIVEGDGSTVVNVYYSRNVYTLQFNIGNVAFTPPAASHVHTDGHCSYKLICGIQDHIHSAECISTLTCTIPEHAAHTAECLTCVLTEHTHGISCTLCDQEGHTHTEGCCALDEHVHDITCYGPNTGYTEGISSSSDTTNNAIAAITNPQAGYIYRYNRNGTYHNFFFTHTGWYYLGTNTQYRGLLNGTISNPNRGAYTVSNLPAILKCGKVEHSHEEGSCDYSSCTLHVHTEACYVCGKIAHTHSAACCTKDVHTADEHTTSCYQGVGNQANPSGAPNNPAEGQVYRRNNNTYYIYINGQWYTYTGSTTSGNIAPTICHVHGDGSCTYCALSEHDHTDDCLDCGLTEHLHGDACYKDAIHAHSDACYTWTCGASAHIHTDECYSSCIKPESYVSGTGSSTKFYIKAKYNQTIGDIWPTSAHYPGLYGWSVEGNTSTTAVSKKINMTSDLCDTTDGVREVDTVTQNTSYTVHLYYMFESFDQSSPENGNERKLYNGVYYDKSELYYQDAESTSNKFNQKSITGMTPVNVVSQRVVGSEYNNFLYYTRARADFKFHNVNTTVQTISNLMYEYPLSNVMVDGKPASEYIPPYPTTYEPGAYEFGGWYTTPNCFDGTEVDWDDGVMPETDLEVYAKWTPIMRNVTFYSAYTDIALDEADTSDKVYHFMKATDVPHGTNLGSTYYDIPEWPEDLDRAENGGPEADMYDFIGWFYMDEDNKKKFAPDSMEVTRDLVLFAEWNTSVDTTYEVRYVLRDSVSAENTPSHTVYPAGTIIADTDAAHASVGKTKTFTAKGLGDLYPDFQKKFFPLVNSHSILMEQQDVGGTQNKFTFEYVYDDTVYYKVRYVDYATRTELRTSKVASTDEAVITEKFLPIEGYIPQNFYIRKALAYDGTATENTVIEENVITFYYVRDTEHGLYSIEYYQEDVDSTYDPDHDDADDPAYFTQFFTQYESIVGSADLNSTITADIRSYQGYTHLPKLNTVITYKTDGSPNAPTVGGGLSGKVDYTGLTIRVYYTRIEYPYKIEYRESGSEKVLATVASDKAKFDAVINHTAPAEYVDTKGNDDPSDDVTYEYYLSNSTEAQRTKEITIRDTSGGSQNLMVFYYTQKKVEVQYHPVCLDPNVPSGVKFGAVSINAESAIAATGLAGSNATPADGFIFKGWYIDETCQTPVESSWLTGATHFTPKELYQDDDWINHYYARFEPVKESLVINKQGENLGDDTFLFRVTGINNLGQNVDMIVSVQGESSVTIRDLYCGTYSVTELTDWSWTYICSDDVQEVSLTTKDTETVYTATFTNQPKAVDWLHGESKDVENQFD